MQAGSWSWWGGQDTLGTPRVVLGSPDRDISGPCRVRMGAGWVLAEGAGCSSAAASLLVSGEGSLPRGWMLQGGEKHPAKSQPLSQHTKNCSFYRKPKGESSNPAHQRAHRAAEGSLWLQLDGMPWPCIATHSPANPPSRTAPALTLEICLHSYSQKKKIVNEKTRWKRGSKLNATAVMLHLSCEGKIKFCLPLEVSSGKIISSLAKWHHIVSSFQPAASLVSRSIFFPGKYSGYLTVVVILHPPPGWI